MEPLGTTGAGVWCSSVGRALHTSGNCKPVTSSVPLRFTPGLHFPPVFVSPFLPHRCAHRPPPPLRSGSGHCTPPVSAHRLSQLIPHPCLFRSAPLRCFFWCSLSRIALRHSATLRTPRPAASAPCARSLHSLRFAPFFPLPRKCAPRPRGSQRFPFAIASPLACPPIGLDC